MHWVRDGRAGLLLLVVGLLGLQDAIGLTPATLFAQAAAITEDTSTLFGTITIVLGDSWKGEPYVGYMLRTTDGEYVLIYPNDPLPLSYQGRQVAVTGTLDESTVGMMRLTGAVVILLDAGPTALDVSGTRRIAMLLLRYGDSVDDPDDPPYYSSLINAASNSVNAFYLEDSYGSLGFQADVYGWYALPEPRSYYVYGGVCGDVYWDRLYEDAIALMDPYVYFPQYSDVSFVMSDYLAGRCAHSTGVVIDADGESRFYAATLMPPWAQNVGVYAHELGHAIGCAHTGWVYGAYDSMWDVMSGGDWLIPQPRQTYYSSATGLWETLYATDPCHHVADHKIRLGWLDGWYTEISTGTRTVRANALAGPLTSYMAIKVLLPAQDPSRKYMTVEARTKINYDQWLPGEGVIIHIVDVDRAELLQLPPAYPIDATPGTPTLNDAQWLVGMTYIDSTYGLSISVLSRTANAYTVRVLAPLYAAEITSAKASPDPALPGSRMTFAITVRNTGRLDMYFSRVILEIYTPDTMLLVTLSTFITIFVHGTQRSVGIIYLLPSTAPAGVWTYNVYVYHGITLLDKEPDRTFTVQGPTITGEIVSVTHAPEPVARGRTVTFAVKIKNTGSSVWPSAEILVMIYAPGQKPGGASFATLTLSIANVQPSVEYTYNLSWHVPFTPTGTYTYNVYLFYGTTPLDQELSLVMHVR